MRHAQSAPRAHRFLTAAFGLVAMASTMALAVGCQHDKPETAGETAISVEAAHPVRGSIAEHMTADAVLSPIAQAAISPKVTAPVRRFLVQRGAHVKQGQLLATLENADLAAAALDSKGTYTAAQAAFDTATKAQVPEEYQRAQLDVKQAKANLDLNQSIVNSRQQLFDQGAVPGRDLDTARAGLVQAQAAYDTAVSHLSAQQSVSREAALKAASGQLSSAQGKYLAANAQVGYTEIRSPISGVVTDRPLFAGETASAGTPLLTVMDTSSLLAKVHLAQSLAQRLALGSVAELTLPGLDEPLQARVSLISPALDPGSTTVEVWLRVDNAAGTLKVGTPVHVQVPGRRAEQALLIPDSALVAVSGGSSYVMAIGADGVAHKRPVTTGIRDAGQAQVLSGLSETDTIVTTGAFTLEDGTKVKVGEPGGDEKSGAPEKPDAP
ncbi:MAG TPA: efflux RND transporter periplasmic adaptor subunit [Acidobacteriaceae bacterium]